MAPVESHAVPLRANKRARAATSQQQGAQDLSREALAMSAAPIDPNSFFVRLAEQAGFPGFPQAAAAAAAATAAPAENVDLTPNAEGRIMAALSSLAARFDQQAAASVVAPSVPAAVTTTAGQQVGKAASTFMGNMKEAETGKQTLGLGRMGTWGPLGWKGIGYFAVSTSMCCSSVYCSHYQSN
jgi:hypothetical protein